MDNLLLLFWGLWKRGLFSLCINRNWPLLGVWTLQGFISLLIVAMTSGWLGFGCNSLPLLTGYTIYSASERQAKNIPSWHSWIYTGFSVQGNKIPSSFSVRAHTEQLPWQKCSASWATEQDSVWRLQTGKKREHQPRTCRTTVSPVGTGLLGHQIQSGLENVFCEVCLPLWSSSPHS